VSDPAPAPRRTGSRLGLAAALVLALWPTVFWQGRLFDEEVPGLLRKNWSDATFLQKAFDSRSRDAYQGRELSYAIDYVDAQWLRLLLSHDVVYLVPPSAVLASLGFVAAGARLAPRALPDLAPATRWLALLVLLGNFVFQSTMGMMYRATKPLVAPLVFALPLLLLAERREPRLGPRSAFTAAFLLALAPCLLDRQGLFYVLAFALALSVAWSRSRRGTALLLGVLGALLSWLLYFRVLGPPIVHALNGYWPSDRFQRLRLGLLLQKEPWLQAADLLGDWTSVLLGGAPPALLLLAAAGAGGLWAFSRRRRPRTLALGAACALAAVLGQLTMVAMMFERHSPVSWLGNRLWYYPLPYQAVFAFGLLWGLERLARGGDARIVRLVPLVLAAFVLANVLRWPEERRAMDSDPPFHDQFRRSDLFVRSFRDGYPDRLLDDDYRRFYFECLGTFPRLAARARPQVAEGDGVLRARIVDGRLRAWAGRDVRLVAWTPLAGRYRLSGSAWLRAGETIAVLLGEDRPRQLAEIRRDETSDGSEPIALSLDLAAGPTQVRLVSSLPEVQVPEEARGTLGAYELALPFMLTREKAKDLGGAAPPAGVDRRRPGR